MWPWRLVVRAMTAPRFATRRHSRSAPARSSKLLTPRFETIKSNVPARYGIAFALPSWSVTLVVPRAASFSFARSRPALHGSSPCTCDAVPSRSASSISGKPVPQPTSSTTFAPASGTSSSSSRPNIADHSGSSSYAASTRGDEKSGTNLRKASGSMTPCYAWRHESAAPVRRCTIAARSRRRADPPDRVADIVGHQQRAALVDGDADRTAHRVAVLLDEAGEHVDRLARGLAVCKRHEDHLVAAPRLAVPRAVLADEHPVT